MSLLRCLRHKSPIIVALTLPFMLGSCVNPALLQAQAGALGALGSPVAKNRFITDQNRTVGQGTAVGGAIGGAVGMALAQRYGPAGILAGVLVGAVIGKLVGEHVAMKKAIAVQSMANLDNAIKEAANENAKAVERLASLRQSLTDLKAKGLAAKAAGNNRAYKQVQSQMRELQKVVISDRKVIDTSVTLQTQLQGKLPANNPKYAEITSGLSEATKTRSGYDSLSNEIGSALTEF